MPRFASSRNQENVAKCSWKESKNLMDEFLYSIGCIAALIVLPILFFMLRGVKQLNRSLSTRVERLEDAVAELRQANPLQAGSRTTFASSAKEDASADATTTEKVRPDGLTDGSPSISQPSAEPAVPPTEQPSVESSRLGQLKGISSARPDAAEPRTSEGMGRSMPDLSALSPLFGWFTKMHLMVQIGILLLFIGIAFLIKFVADQGMLSIELRLLTSAVFGIGLTTVGWRLRNRARTYGMALMGGGLAIAYLTTYGALLYTPFPPTLAFPIFVLLGIIGGLLAVVTDAWILAFLAIAGAFLAPVLASTGAGSHITLFSYYAVVNAGILAIAWFKTWRSLNLVGYIFTMVVGLFWGLNSYTPELFRSTEFFLILFYGFYVLIAVLFAARRSAQITTEIATGIAGEIAGIPKSKLTRHDALDITLIFGNPMVAFSIQSFLMQDVPYGMAISTFVAGIIYAALAVLFVMKRREERWRSFRLVAESFLFLAGLFIALAVPLTFELQATSAIWAVMGLAWVWAGTTRKRWWQVVWGGLIQLGAAVAVMADIAFFDLFDQAAFINGPYLNMILISLSALGSGYLLNRAKVFGAEAVDLPAPAEASEADEATEAGEESEAPEDSQGELPKKPSDIAWHSIGSWAATLWGHLWWFGGGLLQVADFVVERDAIVYGVAASLAFIALSTGVMEWIGARLRWSAVRLPSLLLLPILMVGALIQANSVDWPLAGGGWYAWPIGLAVTYWALYRWDRADAGTGVDNPWVDKLKGITGFYHVGSLWLVVGLVTWIGIYGIKQWTDADGWVALVAIGIPSLVSWLLLNHGDRLAWPIGKHLPLYQTWGAGLLLGVVLMMIMSVNTTSGAATPLPYLPILNPLDLVQIAFFVVAFAWVGRTLDGTKRVGYWIAGVAAFITFNAGLARAVHHIAGTPFEMGLLVDSSTLQTLYAVSWSLLAMVLMFLSHRRGGGWRSVWVGGAIVLGLTVAKLFAIDLANSGTIARIISFMGTGLLTIVIAYFAPVPPRLEEEEMAGGGEEDDKMTG